jgi:hypothetical protein
MSRTIRVLLWAEFDAKGNAQIRAAISGLLIMGSSWPENRGSQSEY